MQGSDQTIQAATAATLPADVRARCNGELDEATIVAWAALDLDDQNRYARHYVVLTENDLLILADGPAREIPIATIEEASIVEGLGVDRLDVIVAGRRVAELHYTRRQRREMTRLHRKLQRRIPRKDGAEPPPDWLETVERQAEAKEHCPRCGDIIPAYAEGVCPRCQQTRRILWRLLDVAKPYRARIWAALFFTFLFSVLYALPAIFLRNLIAEALEPTGKFKDLSQEARVHNLVWWTSVVLA